MDRTHVVTPQRRWRTSSAGSGRRFLPLRGPHIPVHKRSYNQSGGFMAEHRYTVLFVLEAGLYSVFAVDRG